MPLFVLHNLIWTECQVLVANYLSCTPQQHRLSHPDCEALKIGYHGQDRRVGVYNTNLHTAYSVSITGRLTQITQR